MDVESNAQGWESLLQLQQLTITTDPDMDLAFVRGTLPLSMLRKLDSISEVPLRSLELLCTEIEAAAQNIIASVEVIQAKPLDKLLQLLQKIQTKTQQALASSKSPQIQPKIGQLLHHLGDHAKDKDAAVRQSGHLQACLESTTNPNIFEGPVPANQTQEDYAKVAASCVQFFTGCLLHFVPDRPFDPALRPMVERKRHNKRRMELEDKLRALQDFAVVFSGSVSNLRTQVTEKALQALGAEPQVPLIVRPQVSELSLLQAEFNNILSTVVLGSPDSTALCSVFEGQYLQVEEIKLLRANIGQSITRLSLSYHAYEDITKPLIIMLRGLDVGLALSLLAKTRLDSRDLAISHIVETTPLLAASPDRFHEATIRGLQMQRTDQSDLHTHLLKRVAVERSMTEDPDSTNPSPIFEAFHGLYEEWKDQLSQDQRQNATRSTLYRYRGVQTDDGEADDQDLRHLFPTYELQAEEGDGQMNGIHSPEQQARRLAHMHREIFQTTKPSSTHVLQLLQDASRQIAQLWHPQYSLSRSPVPAGKMLSALVLSLDENMERLRGTAVRADLYNFYTDANISEAQKLVQLVSRIQARFIELREAWPEHATLGDVLRTSSELLALRHTEPVAKLLTKTEQLHGYVHEWQVVANKRYTAITLYNELTELLVSWRRLELSTWARLLDMEDHKCSEDAHSWWFIAYEVIVAAPLSLIHNGKHVEGHAEQLFSTLSEFLMSTSMGQYVHRLNMIRCFRGHLLSLERSVPPISTVQNAITNLVNYYSYFEDPIQQSLHKGRQLLEKDMKEILLLASWKDTNINALRDSAKRSHHKLFKVIRKYRALLAQPSETLITQGIPGQATLSGPSSLNIETVRAAAGDARALEVCQNCLMSWQCKPERFTNTASTVERMLLLSSSSSTAIDVAPDLDRFRSDLNESMSILRNETPAKATRENDRFIKHLKARKRKLFADTLKTIRQMGFRSNVSADALGKQASLATILTYSPSLRSGPRANEMKSADYNFHYLLNLIPQARERASSHSEDLTNSDVTKSLGFMESILSMILKQRAMIAKAVADIEALSLVIAKLQSMWAPDSYALRKLSTEEIYGVSETICVLKRLSAITSASSVIIEKFSILGNKDCSNMLDGLSQWNNRIRDVIKTFETLPGLPTKLTSSRHQEVFAEAETLLEGFRAYLQQLIETFPALSFVLEQIVLWTNPQVKSIEQHVNGEQVYDLEELDHAVSSSCDSILVSIQQMQEASTLAPTSDKDSAWLSRMEESLSGRLHSLHLSEINSMLKGAVSKMQHLDPTQSGDLKVAGALCAMALPIVEQYHNISEAAFVKYLRLHRSLCELGSLLVSTFCKVALNGFCNPVEDSSGEAGKSEKLEGGTGLGEGEGAENISKDIQDDEDMSELTHSKNEDKEKEGIEDQEDAVDMDNDDLEGDIGEGSDSGTDDGSASEMDGKDVDEERGSLDDLDPSNVDEKLWDGKAEETKEEKAGPKSNGKAGKDDQIAAESGAQQENDTEDEHMNKDEANEEGAEEGEEIAKEEPRNMDSHAQEGQKLDLPEEMDLDSNDDVDGESVSGNSDLDDMSDMGQDQATDQDEADQQDIDNGDDASEKASDSFRPEAERPKEAVLEEDAADNIDSPVDTEPSDGGQEEDHQRALQDRSDDAMVDPDSTAPSEARGLGESVESQQDGEQESPSQAQASKGEKRSASDQAEPQATARNGQSGPGDTRSEKDQTQDGHPEESNASLAFKKLGDALEKWHRRNQQIRDAEDQEAIAQSQKEDVDMADQDFEHLQDENAEGDTQALGAATAEQAQALDDQALDSETPDEKRNFSLEEDNQEGKGEVEITDNVEDAVNSSNTRQEQAWPSALVVNNTDSQRVHDQHSIAGIQNEEDIKDLDVELSSTHLQPAGDASLRSADEARRLWFHCESLTRDLSLALTEQLRLILAPTLATKMRGDFRTGKRLNIKRIIPYITSQYKRDKIWMRRSIPSKRNYQIMLAVDDSKSMGESGSVQLAFETLALVAKSLSMLEVGEICIVGFGNEVHVAHEFHRPFSSEAGAQMFQHFSFQQTKTNVRRLVAESITLFRDAKRKSINANTDLWQLELIISDGICEDHATIKRLVRQATEERIMIVFVIVDALLKKESIMDMSQAVFEPDDATGETKLKIKRYLDGFPFPYYLVVGDVKDLPGVLAQALRQWFAEVAGSG